MTDSATGDATSPSGATPEANTSPASADPLADLGNTDELGDAARRAIVSLRRESRAAAERLTAERDAALARVQAFEDATGTETEQLRTKIGRSDKRIGELEAENSVLRRRIEASAVAARHGIPDLADRLQGMTTEELEADAKALSERVGAARTTNDHDLGAGARAGGSSTGMDQLIRERARR